MHYSNSQEKFIRAILTTMADEICDIDLKKNAIISHALHGLENNSLTKSDLKFIRFVLVNVGGILQQPDMAEMYTSLLLTTTAMLKERL